MPIEQFGDLTFVGEHAENTKAQMWKCMGVGPVARGAICADGHLGYAQPVGAVIGYRDGWLSISGVGFDIGCGNLAARLGSVTKADIMSRRDTIADDIKRNISFGVGRTRGGSISHPVLDDDDAWKASGMGHLRSMAEAQLGTVGSGNHYVDIFADERDDVWIGVHFGSRGLGHKSATHYLKAAGGQDGINVPPALVQEGTPLGDDYIAAMTLVGRYAYAGREWVVKTIARMLGARIVEEVHNHHNFAWKEIHGTPQTGDEKLWVVRKGCTPAFPGQRGFIGGSMGDDAVIVRGMSPSKRVGHSGFTGHELGEALLQSTVHGAGRIMGRNQAKKTFTREAMDEWLREKDVVLRGGDLDESPMAYRRLTDVLAEHEETIDIQHVLKPLIVCMAGRGDRDPYKD